MAKISFNDIGISAIVTTTGGRRVTIDEEAERFGYDERTLKRLKRSMGFESRYVVADPSVCTSDLCVASAEKIFEACELERSEIEALLLVTQTPDYRAPSTAIIMQDRLGLSTDTVAFDINLGCSGFINGLYTAYCMIRSGLKKILLCVGDVASRFAYEGDRNLTPLMGDAGSAILIEAKEGIESHFVLHSDGSGYEHLIIPDGGCRHPFTARSLEAVPDSDGVPRRRVDMYMNGPEIFNFTIKVVPKMFRELLEYAHAQKEEVDYFVLHQANRYILQNIAKRLEVDASKLPMGTVGKYGNQNSASIPGTINAFLHEPFSSARQKVVFAGFGIGLSWGAVLTEVDRIYAPPIEHYQAGKGDEHE